MILDLTMPLIRKGNGSEYWKTLYINMRGNLYERLQQEKPGNTLAIDICQILENSTVGRRKKKRKQAKEIMNALNEA